MTRRDQQQPLNGYERELLSRLSSGVSMEDLLKPLMKRLIESSLCGELDGHLLSSAESNERIASDDSVNAGVRNNCRNGYGSKRLKTSVGEIEIDTPRDRDSSFAPILVKKGQNSIADGISDKILALYKSGMSYSDIRSHISDMYDMEVSNGTISKITDIIIEQIEEFKSRPLDKVYPIVYMDGIHFKVKDKDDGIVKARTVYSLLAIDCEGRKQILGLYSSDTESATFWSSVIADMKARGLEDILIACIDNLTGFKNAIEAQLPNCNVQLCIVHQIRNSLKYVASKNHKEFIADLKKVYKASSKEIAENELLKLDDKWRKLYPLVINSWHNNWEALSQYFAYSPNIRKLIYTTNPVEGLHRMVRKYTKSKGSFTSQNALEKQIFCAYQKAQKKWTQPIHNWPIIISELDLTFKKRLNLTIN